MGDFIRVNFIETDDKYGCFQIYHKSNLAIICLDNAEKVYYATSFEREGKGIRRISECEYDRLCKELGVEIENNSLDCIHDFKLCDLSLCVTCARDVWPNMMI